ncbi:MAG: tetratricopeptide repeat protein [Bdellovibrionales bacterium]|nr:tetratricopeptide repeat protein [Bdellovibrionales bacterium]
MNRILFTVLLAAVMGIFASGCLRTRADLQDAENKKEMSDKLSTLQQTAARDEVRFQDYDEQLRHMRGRVETLEHSLALATEEKDKLIKEKEATKTQTDERLKLYEEALRKLESQVGNLSQELEQAKKASAASATSSGSSDKGNFGSAEDAYGKKNWKAAIVGYQKYREANPTGKKYGEATLKIGVCFQELGMNSDARAFFDEVVEKFPKSAEAKEAKTRLKSIKK